MIQLDELHIEEFRGIRKLTLELNRKSFAVQGPNGSGKSGVVDAIEFGLTGDVTRLSGTGTRGLTVKKHGPHVDARETLESAFVRLKVYLPNIDKTATITRTVKNPTKPRITPADADVLNALARVSQHPEIALSRRQIIKFILTEATSRSKDVQTLLRLDAIEKIRAAMKTASNRSSSNHDVAKKATDGAADALKRHIDSTIFTSESILEAVNLRRAQLELLLLVGITADNSVKEGLEDRPANTKEVTKPTAQRDLEALKEMISKREADEPVTKILKHVVELEENPALYVALRRQQLVEVGLELLESDQCPLCDTQWELEDLRQHLQSKLDDSKKAVTISHEIMASASAVSAWISSVNTLVESVCTNATRIGASDLAAKLKGWGGAINDLSRRLETLEQIVGAKDHLCADWQHPDDEASNAIRDLEEKIARLPDRSTAADANNFLVVADERLEAYRRCKREEKKLAAAASLAHTVYDTYCAAATSVLETLYSDVEQAFTDSYRAINGDDEGEFTAKLTPAEGRLDLDVDFHKRGLFHPGAYHSEGHQDGMGLCLYLALMKQLFGDEFRLVILDDVVMSVDSQHRKHLCRLLKDRFPNTQFIITTHEKAWFHQMQRTGLITRKFGVTFRGWTVDSGPLVNEATDVWEDIEAALTKDDVPSAAARLRRYLEFAAAELAEGLAASVRFCADGDHDLGDVLPSVIGRFKKLLGQAASSAQAWKNDEAAAQVKELKASLRRCSAESDVERWAINRAVHFNAWADFVREDFEPVVAAFKALLQCFECPECRTWLYVTPRKGSEESLRCDCGRSAFNLKTP